MAQEIDYKAREFDIERPVPATFFNLDEPRRVSKSEKETPKYSARIELDPEVESEAAVLKGVRAKIMSVASANWPGWDIGQMIRDKELIVPIVPGSRHADKAKAKGKDQEWVRAKQTITARTAKAPAVGYIKDGKAYEDLGPDAIKTAKTKFFFNGATCLFSLSFAPYDATDDDSKPGVTCYLEAVMSTGKGTKVGGSGRPAMSDRFKSYIGLESQEDPTGASKADEVDW